MGATYRARSAPLGSRYFERTSFRLVVALTATILAAAFLPFWKVFVMVGMAAGMAMGLARHRRHERRGDGHPMAVSVDGEEVRFRHHPGTKNETTTSLWRPLVKMGCVVPTDGKARLSLRGRFTQIANLETESIEDARELLHELGFSPLERPMTFAFFFNLRVTVGVDGVLVALPLIGRKRFVPHESIVDIRQTSTLVILALRNGTTYEIATGGGEQHAALVERLVEATRAYVDADHTEPLAVLRQSGRTPTAWVKELRALMQSAGAGYRSATIPEETLWRVVLDPSEPIEHRIGAGLALRATLDDEGRARLRGAAEAAVAPRVRIALETAATEPDDDAVAEVLQRRL